MALLSAFISYLIKFIVFLCIAAGGFVFGKKLREKKNDKLSSAGEK